MSDTYYKQCLLDIQKLRDENKLEEAYARVSEELSMPYVPKTFLSEIEQLEKELRSELKTNEKIQTSLTDPHAILKALKGDDEQVIFALDSLSKLNLRHHIELIQEAFDLLKDSLMKALLIRICIEQALVHEFKVEMEGFHYEIIPMSLCLPEDSDGFEIAENYLENWCMKEPSLYQLCLQELHLQSLLKLPMVYEAEEGYDLAITIMEKMVTALYDKDAFEAMKDDLKEESIPSSTH